MINNKIERLIKQFNNSKKYNNGTEYIYHSYAMGTLVNLKINTSESEFQKIFDNSINTIKYLERLMSFYDISSQISQINNEAGKSWVPVNPELFFVIKESKRYACLTMGLFDITVAPVVELWTYYGKLNQIPPWNLLKKALEMVNYQEILIDEVNKRVKLSRKGQKIDLGGIAKGYAANQVIKLYKKMGIDSGIIDLGGNIKLLGSRNDGKPWKVGIQNPDKGRGKCLGTVILSDTSVVTSGDYERSFIKNNRLYHHILNPYTGYPSFSQLRSVTVIHPDSMLADVMATTIFIAGLESGSDLIKYLPGIEVIIISNSNRIYLSRNITEKFQILENGFEIYQI